MVSFSSLSGQNGQTVVQTNNKLQNQLAENTGNINDKEAPVRTNGQTVVQTIVQTENEISASERMVLDIIRNNEGLSKAEIASRIGKSERSAQRIISSLIKKELLEPQGANQARTWRIRE